MKWDCNGPRGGQALDHKPLDQQKRQRTGETAPALVLESMDRMLDRSFVGDRGPQARQRAQAQAAATVGSSALDLSPAPAAQRLLEAPDTSTTGVAEPRADAAAAAASRRQKQVDEVRQHEPRLPTCVKPAFTGKRGVS
jgi:hypothetical protein